MDRCFGAAGAGKIPHTDDAAKCRRRYLVPLVHILSFPYRSISMKKQYATPQVRRYGTVDAITGAFGSTNQTDTIFNSDGSILATDQEGSVDGVVVPCSTVEAPC